jgi:hypothetical protein
MELRDVQRNPAYCIVSMAKQKEMHKDYYESLMGAKDNNHKVVYTLVPGNMTKLIRVFDGTPVYPEIHTLQSGMRRTSDAEIKVAEEAGQSEDVRT